MINLKNSGDKRSTRLIEKMVALNKIIQKQG